jgi:hypothetical protein
MEALDLWMCSATMKGWIKGWKMGMASGWDFHEGTIRDSEAAYLDMQCTLNSLIQALQHFTLHFPHG